MKLETHIRIRVPNDLNEKIQKALSKSENKSGFIRDAILEKINNRTSVKKIGILNKPNFPIDDWSIQSLSLEDLFKIPLDLTRSEIDFAYKVMETFSIETDNNEDLIELLARPSDFMSFLVQVKRIVDQQN